MSHSRSGIAPAPDRYRRSLRITAENPPAGLPWCSSCSRGTRARLRQLAPFRWRPEGALRTPPLRVHRLGIVPPPLPGAGPAALARRHARDRHGAREQPSPLLPACAPRALVVRRGARNGRGHVLGLLGAALDGRDRAGFLPPLLLRPLADDTARQRAHHAARELARLRCQLRLP